MARQCGGGPCGSRQGRLAVPTERLCRDVDRTAVARLVFARAAAQVLARYPRPASLVDAELAKAVRGAGETLVVYHGHEVSWVEHRGKWVCLHCGQSCGRARRGLFTDSACTCALDGKYHDRLWPQAVDCLIQAFRDGCCVVHYLRLLR